MHILRNNFNIFFEMEDDADTARIGLPNGFDNWSFSAYLTDMHAGAYVGLGFLSKL